MATFTLIAQDVNGDPFVSGANINITNNSTTELIFQEVDNVIDDPVAGEGVSLDGGITFLGYEYLGVGDVRNDTTQSAAFIRVDLGDGSYQTFAIDLNLDGDGVPNLDNGNTKLVVAGLDATNPATFPNPPCFVAGTLIQTPTGPRPVEDLKAGDLVRTLDRGVQAITWTGARSIDGRGLFAPIRFEMGTLGNDRPLLVSPQHRILVSGWRAEILFGEAEVLVAARLLVNGRNITVHPMREVTYHHFLCAQHELVWSNGCVTESFFPGDVMMQQDQGIYEELMALFPELAPGGRLAKARTARRVLKGYEAMALEMSIHETKAVRRYTEPDAPLAGVAA